MNLFKYKIRTENGIMLEGDFQADNRHAAAEMLKHKGYYIIQLTEENRLNQFIRQNLELGNFISTRQKAIFTHQFGTLLKAGMRLSSALELLSKQTKNKYLASIIENINHDIEESMSLSDAIAKHKKLFSPVYVAIIHSAEMSGKLPETLLRLSTQMKKQVEIKSKIKSALTYPAFLIFISTVIIGILFTFIVPKFIQLFINANQDLPLPTQILISINNSIHNYWHLILLTTVASLIITITSLRQKHIKILLHSVLLNLPLIGIIQTKSIIAQFAITLGSLLDGGVDIISSFKITRKTITNLVFKAKIMKVEEAIMKGSSVSDALSQHDIDITFVNMIAVGEQTGRLPEMLYEISEIYDHDTENAIHAFTTILGPAMIVFMGGLVGFIVMAVLLPIFQTSSIIK